MEVMLKTRNFNGPSTCFMCGEEEEMVDYLLMTCRWVSSLGHLSLCFMEAAWVQPFSVKDDVLA